MLVGDLNLYSSGKNRPKVATGFANSVIAKQTLSNIAHLDVTYQKQVVITMYNRAKYHPYQTPDMQKAMSIFAKWLKKHNVKIYSRSKKISRSRSKIKTKKQKK